MDIYEIKKHKKDFFQFLDVERNVSINTYKSYQYDLDQFVRFWISLHSPKLEFKVVIEKFFMHLYGKKLKKSSIARKVATFKSFESYLISQNIPIKLNLIAPKIEKRLPTYLTIEEVTFLLDELPDEMLQSKFPLRDRAMFETLYATGIRCSELSKMKIADIDFDQKTIMITGKGNKQRIVIFNEITKKRIFEYIKKERSTIKKNDSEFLFLTSIGTVVKDRTIQKIIKNFSNHLPSNKEITPHKIRHSFATHMLNAGMNLRELQELLGHSSLGTTEHYTHITMKDLQELYTKIDPLKLDFENKE